MNKVIDEIKNVLDEENELRERAYEEYRNAVKASRRAIKSILDGKGDLKEVKEFLKDIRTLLKKYPIMHRYGFIEDALTEISEAIILDNLLKKEVLPPPSSLSLPPRGYLLGLGDAIGELRRAIVTKLINGDIESSRTLLKRMEEIYDVLNSFVYPSSLIQIKRKQDIARSLLERTRGEYLIALYKNNKL